MGDVENEHRDAIAAGPHSVQAKPACSNIVALYGQRAGDCLLLNTGLSLCLIFSLA